MGNSCLSKISETVNLMEKAYKTNVLVSLWFLDGMAIKKKIWLSAKLDTKPDWSESVLEMLTFY